MTLESNDKVPYLKSVLWLVTQTSLLFLDKGCSYLVHEDYNTGFRLQMTLKSKIKVSKRAKIRNRYNQVPHLYIKYT